MLSIFCNLGKMYLVNPALADRQASSPGIANAKEKGKMKLKKK